MTRFIDMGSCRMYNLDYIRVKEVVYNLNKRIRRGDTVPVKELYYMLDIPVCEGLRYKKFDSVIEMEPDARGPKPKGMFLVIRYKYD